MTWLKDLGAYAAVKPFDVFPGFFLSGYVLVILTLVLPDQFAQWPGFTALARDSASAGAGRFLIDSSLPIALIYIGIIVLKLSRQRCREVQLAMAANSVHRYPVLGALFFITQFPLLILLYEPQDDFVYALTSQFWVVAYCMPWFAYLAANSFSIIVSAADAWQFARRSART
ncbi:MAG: hypothetical protein NTX56_04735 [Proteobacteria bacterium]|nr:hypothetical protein [Pseudomonadota bacterium]